MTIEFVVLVVGGVIAGIIGTAGGITSLVAYPLLLAVGIPPLTANITGSVAMLGSGIGSTLRARPDLIGHRQTLTRWLPVVVAGSLAGAILLLVTPADLFGRIVPFLVAAGAALLLLQPRITRWNEFHSRRVSTGATAVAVTGVTIYNGYFGAGSGVLMIAVLLLTVEPLLLRANALKNVLLVTADLLPAVLFAVFGTVIWWAVLALGVGTLIGGLIGPSVARRIPHRPLRILIALSGFALAVWLFLHP
ncbi:sulfite exporter TauE/SafE family protein [Glaciihabitans sp. dw_435]|uniref:sulfite exporter TauE/SafE family protein n=1 Tax=Glaciihabitans sp. dw_435 TaxID=2720081 RepID=UPI001BD550AE|nr:sulfite exporter TauE/SafE family protein [Glaciihabitans sp. dw_435]